MPRTDPATGEQKQRFRRIRTAPLRLVSRVPWLRRRYVRWMLRTIKKHHDKNRRLPENLARLDRQLRRLPEPKRAQALEEMLELGPQAEASYGRAMRRAAGRQERQSGKKGGRVRPGMAPGQRRVVR